MALDFVVPGRLIPVLQHHDVEQVRRSARQVADRARLGAPDLAALAQHVTEMATGLAAASGGWVSVRDLGPVGGPGVEATAFGRADAVTGSVTPTWNRFPASPSEAGSAYVTGLVAAADDAGGAHGWRAWHGPTSLGILVCAAVGGGPQGAQLLERALSFPAVTTPRATLRVLHGMLAGTAGVAAAAIEVDLAARTARAASVGDVVVDLLADGVRTVAPARRGVVGVGSRPPGLRGDEVTVGWSRGLSVVVHTAGIEGDGWTATGGAGAHPALLCARLMQEHRTAAEDACVVAVRVGLP
jgi:hypothetical protein